jgi:hypothetical protein
VRTLAGSFSSPMKVVGKVVYAPLASLPGDGVADGAFYNSVLLRTGGTATAPASLYVGYDCSRCELTPYQWANDELFGARP